MGYYTDYALSVFRAENSGDGSIKMKDYIPTNLEDQIKGEIEKMSVFEDGNIQDAYYVNTTWYDHEQDMRLLSAKFPDMVFWLSGHGDDAEDIWDKYFIGGKMQACYAEIVRGEFDPTKLDDGGTPLEQKYSYQY